MAKYCFNCGFQLKDEDLFCPECGSKQPVSSDAVNAETPASEITAAPDDTYITAFSAPNTRNSTPESDLDNAVSPEESSGNNTSGPSGENGYSIPRSEGNGAGAPYFTQGHYAPYQAPQIEKKKKSVKLLIIVVAAILILGGTAAILLFVAPGFLKGKEKPVETTSAQTSTPTETSIISGTTSMYGDTSAPETETTSSATSAITSTSAESATESVTPPTQSKELYGFDYYGLPVFSDFDKDYTKEYAYNTYIEEENKEISGRIVISDHIRNTVSQDMLEFGNQNGIDLTGYETVMFTGDIIFDAADIQAGNDPSIYPVSYDYYDIKGYKDSLGIYTDTDNDRFSKATVETDGGKREVYSWVYVYPGTEEDSLRKYEFMFVCCVPEGYDGLVLGFAHGAEYGTDDYLFNVYDPFIYCLFRMK